MNRLSLLFIVLLSGLLQSIHSLYKLEELRNNPIKDPWDLPTVPQYISHEYPNYTESQKLLIGTKKIPNLIWIGFRVKPNVNNTPTHLKELIDNNIDWKHNFYGHDEYKEFMEKNFYDTSILWAFRHVSTLI